MTWRITAFSLLLSNECIKISPMNSRKKCWWLFCISNICILLISSATPFSWIRIDLLPFHEKFVYLNSTLVCNLFKKEAVRGRANI